MSRPRKSLLSHFEPLRGHFAQGRKSHFKVTSGHRQPQVLWLNGVSQSEDDLQGGHPNMENQKTSELTCRISNLAQAGRPRFGSVRLRFGGGTVRAVLFSVPPVPLQKAFFSVSVEFDRKGRFRFRFRFLENGSSGSGSAFGSGKNGSDGSGFRFQFGS